MTDNLAAPPAKLNIGFYGTSFGFYGHVSTRILSRQSKDNVRLLTR